MQQDAPGGGGGAGLNTDTIGKRVTVRVLVGGVGPSGGPVQRDVVGILEAADTARLVIRRLDGTTERVDRDRIALAKVVPDPTRRVRRAADVGVPELERIAAIGWQPIEQSLLGDWLLRAAKGFTGRANSVLPLGDPGLSLDSALDRITGWYSQRSLPAQFQVPTPYADDLAADLVERGWVAFNPTQVLVADLKNLLTQPPGDASPLTVHLSAIPDAAWLATYNYRGRPLPPIAEQVLVNTTQPLFASAITSEAGVSRTVAVARAAITGSWVGLTALEVEPSYRRSGIATQLMQAVVTEVQRRGARHAYLQVADESTAALAFYKRLGFTSHHRYHYLRSNGL